MGRAPDAASLQLTGDGLKRYGSRFNEAGLTNRIDESLWHPTGEGLLLAWRAVEMGAVAGAGVVAAVDAVAGAGAVAVTGLLRCTARAHRATPRSCCPSIRASRMQRRMSASAWGSSRVLRAK